MTCSRPQRKAPRLRIEPGTSGTGVNHSTPAPVRSTVRIHMVSQNIRINLSHILLVIVKYCHAVLWQNLNLTLRQISVGGKTFDGEIPKEWSLANICPLFKKGDRSLACNYRPVS